MIIFFQFKQNFFGNTLIIFLCTAVLWWEKLEMATAQRTRRTRTQKKKRGQGQEQPFLRTDTLEAKDRNARGKSQEPRTLMQVFSPPKKSRQNFFSADLQNKKRSRKNFSADLRNFIIQKTVLFSSRGQGNF